MSVIYKTLKKLKTESAAESENKRISKKGKKLTEPRVAVRKRAKHTSWRKLGSGEGTQ